MQKPKDKVAINSIPYGAYEAGTTDGEMRTDEKYHLNEICTDIQGNGYPVAANKANPATVLKRHKQDSKEHTPVKLIKAQEIQ